MVIGKLENVFCSIGNRLRSCENAIGVMTKLQTSLVAEETWVDGAAEKLASLPTATSAYELDVSISLVVRHNAHTLESLLFLIIVDFFDNTNIFFLIYLVFRREFHDFFYLIITKCSLRLPLQITIINIVVYSYHSLVL